ncbi:MAG: hypothetical protein AAGM22_10545 [Acidobacteriota bacterium]
MGKASPTEVARTKKISLGTLVIAVAALITGLAVSVPAGLAVGVIGLGLIGLWLWLFAPPPKRAGGADPSAINYGR